MECLVFLGALAVFLFNSFKGNDDEKIEKTKTSYKDWLTLIIGSVAIYFSATYTIYAMEEAALEMEIPVHIISITIVALGTSLPEVIVSITAAKKGNHGMAVGNVLGSNIFNTYAVMAIPGLMGNLTIPEDIMSFSIPFMIVVTVLFGIICLSKRISRWEGYMLLIFYAFFIGTLLDQQLT
jgi:cation:H+ antiporter